MVLRRLLLTVLVLAIGSTVMAAGPATAECSLLGALDEHCAPSTSAHAHGDSVEVRAEVTPRGGATGSEGEISSPEGPRVIRDASDCGTADLDVPVGVICRNDLDVFFAGTTIPFQPITLADIAAFRPQAVAVTAEPDGWALRGVPANFVADARQHVVPGTLLGAQADVRFTPVSWRWDYGDGSARTTTTGGATWAALGQRNFTPTATSHVYGERGTVTVSGSVTYRAEYRFGGSAWGPVVGLLSVSTPSQNLLVSAASTVLVADRCAASATSADLC